MKYLQPSTDKDVFPNPEFPDRESYEPRATVKVIVTNSEGKIALITNDVHHLYTFPGGGAESDDLVREVNREAIEEIGYDLQDITELVRMKELRNREGKAYENVCFTAIANRAHEEDFRTPDERNNNLHVEWCTVEEVSDIYGKQMNMLKEGSIPFYNTAFNIYRDNAFWQEYLKR